MRDKNIDLAGATILITGAAGFIGANLCGVLLKTVENIRIVGIDNMNDYYDISLKKFRLEQIEKIQMEVSGLFIFVKGNIADKQMVFRIFKEYSPDIVVNLAAQAGVRYSIVNPDVYMEANVIGFYNILEACRYSYDEGKAGVQHLVYASSSSVYGSNKKVPYTTKDRVDQPVSLYAATKRSNELFAYTYSKLYGIPVTGLRFFTVYGPAGRPDMAYFNFTNKLISHETIQLFNYGRCKRDFTYIDDIVDGIVRVMQCHPVEDEEGVCYKIYNIGNNSPENLMDFVDMLQQVLKEMEILPENYDFDEHKELIEMQPGDVEITYADITDLETDFGFKPQMNIRDGLRKFAEWYKGYYVEQHF